MSKALFGNVTMLALLRYLMKASPGTAADMARDCQIPLNMVQKQLSRLDLGRILVPIYEGRRKVYHWNRELPWYRELQRLLAKMFDLRPTYDDAPDAPDAADGRRFSVPSRLRVAENLRCQGESLMPRPRPRPFAKSFDSFEAYDDWKDEQANPWLL